jgi:uncharacterized membrane protein
VSVDDQLFGAIVAIFEWIGVGVLVIGTVLALLWYGRDLLRGRPAAVAFSGMRKNLGNTILLGLEFLVAADIIRTVAVETTLQNVVTLGLIVFIRTFLSWSLDVEIEGKWPWQRAPSLGATPPEASSPPERE